MIVDGLKHKYEIISGLAGRIIMLIWKKFAGQIGLDGGLCPACGS